MSAIQTQPGDLAPDSPAPLVAGMEETIQRWKAEGRKPYAVTVNMPDVGLLTAYFSKATRNLIAYALTLTMSKKVLEAGEFLMKNTWLGGDERLNPNSPAQDDDAIIAAAIEIAQKLELLSAEVKKL